MAWTTMHFAAGMAGSGAVAVVACSVMRRGWRWLPAAMTLGGLWALVPDMPRIFREDAPWLPLSQTLGSKSLEAWLHQRGDWFFLHLRLDAQPHEYALHGLVGILVLYNAAIWLLMHLEKRQRLSLANRISRAHGESLQRARQQRQREIREPQTSPATMPIDEGPIPFPGTHASSHRKPRRA